jgi:hypothetical protein
MLEIGVHQLVGVKRKSRFARLMRFFVNLDLSRGFTP